MRVGARLIVLIVFAVVMSSLWFGGYTVFLSAINSLDVAANLSEILNEALWMGAPALCVASVAWWVATRRGSHPGASAETTRADLLAALMLILVGVTGLFVFFADLAGGYMLALDFVIVVIFLGALRLIVALRRWASSPSGQRSGALDGAIYGANATLLTVIFLVAAVVALLLSLWAYQTVALPTWFLIGTLLGWYSVPITTAIGALYGALVHRVIIISDTSPDEPPLSRFTDATLAP